MSVEQQQRSVVPETPAANLRSDMFGYEGLLPPAFFEIRRKLGNFAAITAVGMGSVSWAMSGQVEATKDECTDAAHQQVVAEAGARATARSIFDDKRLNVDQLAEQLSDQRGYHISGPQITQANQASDILADDEFTSGVHCIDVPGPVYAGFYATEVDDTLRSIAHSHGVGVKALRRFNPPFQKQPAEEPLEAGLTLRVSRHTDTRHAYREMTEDESDIATLAAGKPKLRQELLNHNESLLSTGENITAGAEAWLPLQPTEWLQDEKIKLKDIKETYHPSRYQAILVSETRGQEINNDIVGSVNRASPGISRYLSVRSTEQLAERGPEWKNRAEAMRYFIDRGLKDFQAAGFVGNFVIETGDKSRPCDIHQYGGGPGRGLAQWEAGARFEDLKRFAKKRKSNWKDCETQLAFVMHELRTTEKEAFKWLQKTKNVRQATDAVLNGYERPRERIIKPRLAAAQKILEAYRAQLQ